MIKLVRRTKPIYPDPITFEYDIITRNGKNICRARAATVQALLKKHAKQNIIRLISQNVVEVTDALLIQKLQKVYHSDLQRSITRKNKCVACGEEDLGLLTVHHVVPQQFVHRLPKTYYGNLYHDKLCLCVNCHTNYELIATEVKKSLAQTFHRMLVNKQYGEFIRWWRHHFVETMKPKYLPDDFTVDTSFGKQVKNRRF